jgi:hypothetical protein
VIRVTDNGGVTRTRGGSRFALDYPPRDVLFAKNSESKPHSADRRQARRGHHIQVCFRFRVAPPPNRKERANGRRCRSHGVRGRSCQDPWQGPRHNSKVVSRRRIRLEADADCALAHSCFATAACYEARQQGGVAGLTAWMGACCHSLKLPTGFIVSAAIGSAACGGYSRNTLYLSSRAVAGLILRPSGNSRPSSRR